jgi:hypothetical protein
MMSTWIYSIGHPSPAELLACKRVRVHHRLCCIPTVSILIIESRSCSPPTIDNAPSSIPPAFLLAPSLSPALNPASWPPWSTLALSLCAALDETPREEAPHDDPVVRPVGNCPSPPLRPASPSPLNCHPPPASVRRCPPSSSSSSSSSSPSPSPWLLQASDDPGLRFGGLSDGPLAASGLFTATGPPLPPEAALLSAICRLGGPRTQDTPGESREGRTPLIFV